MFHQTAKGFHQKSVLKLLTSFCRRLCKYAQTEISSVLIHHQRFDRVYSIAVWLVHKLWLVPTLRFSQVTTQWKNTKLANLSSAISLNYKQSCHINRVYEQINPTYFYCRLLSAVLARHLHTVDKNIKLKYRW